ncbi:ABC transporter substrate-binding protein [Pseudogracilibacillus auburnensis]|uniref:ABC transporter substrate-binding protein n=1 Tax=Pseudogracilibacillus auburnensis TaxID=1494959 RepID=UPI001A96601C|nr:extracellular solute-binding protein [Pseudogracilibacillus auburnensis]MBO1001764.1 extracellular solute-binding protein [Pseudogracilibacillus auburnensis]
MNKKLIYMILLMVFSIVSVGCSSDSEKGAGKSSSDDTVELEMYSWRTEDRSAYEKIIEEFENENPDIKINFQPYESTEYNTILTNSLVSGTGPDIVQIRPYSGSRTIADNGYLVALDDVPGVLDIDESYLEAAKGSDGHVYGVPLTLNAGVIFYNQTIFDDLGLEVPETWDELIEVSKKMKENDITPIAQGGRDAYLLSMLHGVISPSAYGSDYVEDVIDGTADLQDDRMVKSLERMEELAEYLPKDFIALDDNDAQAMFYAEEAAMYINGDYRLETFETNIPDIPIGVIPGLKDDSSGEVSVMNWVDSSYGVVKDSNHPEEALKFIEFMATQEFGQLFSDNLNRVSAIEGVTADHEIVQKINQASEASSTPYLMLVHFGDGSPSTKTIFEDALQGMYLDQITKEELLKSAQENADRAAEEEVEELEMIEEDD